MSFDILRHRAALTQCREEFLLHYAAEIAAFDQLDKVLPRYAGPLGQIPVVLQKHTFQLVPFLHIMQRRARTAFEHLTVRQSALAWIALRSFLEAPLIIGKWVDDPQNAVIWTSRNTGKAARKEYQDAYSGEALRPRSLPGAEPIRNVLARLDDDFIQANPRYYARPITFAPGGPRIAPDLADDDADLRAHVYAILHLAGFVLRSLGQLIAQHQGDKPELKLDLEKLQRELGPAAEAIARQNETHKAVLTNLGLWPHELLHRQHAR